MPTLDQMLHPRCPNHPRMLAERFGVCVVCEMTTHRHLSGFKLIRGAPTKTWGNPQGRFVQEVVDPSDPDYGKRYWEPRDDD